MRRWARAGLGAIAIVVLAFAALGGTAAYYVFRNMDKRQASEPEAVQAIESVKPRFGVRPPLVEIVDPRTADIRITRVAEASPVHVDTVHIINWNSETRELTRAELPLWLMRFSSVNLLSQLGVAPERLRLTVSDIERYGPGILVDYGASGGTRVLVWVD